MNSLNEKDMLAIWQKGQSLSLLGRGLCILQHSYRNCDKFQLQQLPLGVFNYLLIKTREATFGNIISSQLVCHHCLKTFEFELNTKQLCSTKPIFKLNNYLSQQNKTLKIKAITINDILQGLELNNLNKARELIFANISSNSEIDINHSKIQQDILSKLERIDAYAEFKINLRCAECNVSTYTFFEIIDYLWQEITITTQDLLSEIHLIANHYHWSREDILKLSDAEKNYYLKRIVKA